MYIRAGIQLKLITETANETNDDLQYYVTLSLRSTLENDGGRNYIMYNSDYPELSEDGGHLGLQQQNEEEKIAIPDC